MSPQNLPARLAGWSLASIAIATLAGCGALTPGHGLDQVSTLTAACIGQALPASTSEADQRALAQATSDILARPIGADEAVRLAVLNSPSLRSLYASVGIAQAELAQAGRLANPSLTFQRTHAGAQVEIERSLGFNLVNLLTAPLARRIEAGRFEQTRLIVASQVIAHAAQTRRAYYSALAARQGAQYARQVSASAAAGAQLAIQMNKVGNMSRRDLAREQAFAAEAAAAAMKAELQANAAREALTVLIGLSGAEAAYTLPDRLPELPGSVDELGEIEQLAVNERLDVRAAKVEAEQTAATLGLAKRTRLVNVFDLAYVNNSAAGQSSAPGYAITLELPLFDWGSARVAGAEARYMQSVSKVAQLAVEARSAAREHYLGYRSSYQIARQYRDEVIPLRKKVADETLLRYNGMLVSVFELLADSREQAAAVNRYIDALKEFWLARTALEAALGGRLPANGSVPASAPNKETAHDHS